MTDPTSSGEFPNPTSEMESLKAKVQDLSDRLLEQEHRPIAVARNLLRKDVWARPESRNATLLAATHLVFTHGRALMVMSSLGGIIAIGIAAWQTTILSGQTIEMSDQTAAMIEQNKKMDEATVQAREQHLQQRQTDMIELFYGDATKPPVRTMALRELVATRNPDLLLTDADLASVRLQDANFEGIRMLRADLTDAYFPDSDFDQANLQSAQLRRTTFGILDEGNPATLQQTVLSLAVGENADFSGASLAQADLRSAVLPRSNFQHTSGAFLDGSSSNFVANRRECKLEGRARLVASFAAESGSPSAEPPQLPPQTDLSHSSFWHSRWAGSSLPGANLRGAELTGTRFVHALLDVIELQDSAILGADFGCASLDSSSFDSATITATSFQHAVLESVSFRNATFSAVDFSNAAMGCADFTGATIDDDRQDELIRFDGADLRLVTGISPQLWRHSCVDEHTRLPAGAPTDLPTCPPNERPRVCYRDHGRQVGKQIGLSDLLSTTHFFYDEIRGFITAIAAERGFEVIDDMTVNPSQVPAQKPNP